MESAWTANEHLSCLFSLWKVETWQYSLSCLSNTNLRCCSYLLGNCKVLLLALQFFAGVRTYLSSWNFHSKICPQMPSFQMCSLGFLAFHRIPERAWTCGICSGDRTLSVFLGPWKNLLLPCIFFISRLLAHLCCFYIIYVLKFTWNECDAYLGPATVLEARVFYLLLIPRFQVNGPLILTPGFSRKEFWWWSTSNR